MLTQTLLTSIPNLTTNLSEISCGQTNTSLNQQRVDIEWQDTWRWNDQLRTVMGISYRQDAAHSETYFDGRVQNDTWRLFSNVEYRLTDSLIFNAGGMAEYEAVNDLAFSPRVAANYLITPSQSIRAVISQAVRSPDLLERKPDFRYTVKNALTDDGETNYIGQSSGTYFLEQVVDDEEALVQEKITSYELGYYWRSQALASELDIKVFREELRDLISDPISLSSSNISNDGEMDIDGAEFQLVNQFTDRFSHWLTFSYTDIDNRYNGDDLEGKALKSRLKLEQRLNGQNSVVSSWMYQGRLWRTSLSYFNHDGHPKGRPYERWQWNVAKTIRIASVEAELSYFIQHNRLPYEPLSYTNQVYNSPNIYYGQLKVEF